MKTYRWLALGAALLITVCEVLLFDTQAGRDPQQHVSAAAAPQADNNSDRHRSAGESASVYWAAAEAHSPARIR